jgi:hypothetical protein
MADHADLIRRLEADLAAAREALRAVTEIPWLRWEEKYAAEIAAARAESNVQNMHCAKSAFPPEGALGKWTMKPSRSCASCAEWEEDDCAPGRLGLCKGFSVWSAKE